MYTHRICILYKIYKYYCTFLLYYFNYLISIFNIIMIEIISYNKFLELSLIKERGLRRENTINDQ